MKRLGDLDLTHIHGPHGLSRRVGVYELQNLERMGSGKNSTATCYKILSLKPLPVLSTL